MLETVPAKQLDVYAQDKHALVIDLRTPEQYRSGHICGAVNIPMGAFGEKWPEHTRILVLYCDRGALSMAVGRELSKRGYQVKSIVGGFRAYRGKRIVTGSETGENKD